MTAASDIDDPLLGEDIAGYRIVARIGEGGMGRVYRGVLPSIGAQVAIKVLSRELVGDAEMAERFVTEARLANLVRHDGLVNVIGVGVLPDGRPYQIMELLTGEPLGAIIRRRGALPLGSLCALIGEALAALAPMHARGIVHRDLKPSNLFVTGAGRLKIIDFGIAKLTSQRGLTRTGQTLGTPDYMAPEQLDGDDVDGRTDLYALGVVLFEGATGVRPFAGRVLEALATHPEPPSAAARVPGAPAALDTVIRTAMASDRGRRYADARAMEAALRELIAAVPPDAFAPLREPEDAAAPPPEIAHAGTGPARPVTPTPPVAAAPPEQVTRTLPTPERLDKYEVRGVIGQGGAGVVMIGFDPAVNRRVALKVLHDSGGRRRDRLIAEARAMAKVGHPNVVTLYELGDDAGHLFLVMELVEGTDVAEWLRDRERPWRAIVDVFVAAGRGLAAAHAVGVIHRDFKPSNVLLGADGRPRVSDFGLAHTDAEDGASGGTAAYMAPEQLEGAPADPGSDQFAFAASLWEALHGELPFSGTSAVAIATAARAGKYRLPANAEVPAAINAALRRGLAPDRRDRFPAVADLIAAIERAIRPPSRAWRPWIAAGVVAAAAAAVATVVATRTRAPAPPATPRATIEDIRGATDPGDVFAELARLPPAELATEEARTLAAMAARSGPTRMIDAGGQITAIAFSADSKRVAIATARELAIHDLDGGRVVRAAPPPIPAVVLRFDPGGTSVVALVADGVVEIPIAGGAARYRARCPAVTGLGTMPGAGSIAASQDLRYIACPRAGGSTIHDTRASPSRQVLDLVGIVTFAFDGTRVSAHDPAGGLTVHDLATGRELGRRALDPVTIVVDNGTVIGTTSGTAVTLWNPVTDAEITIDTGDDLDQLTLTPGANAVLITSARAAGIGLWDLSGNVINRWRVPGVLLTTAVPADDPMSRVVMRTAEGATVRDLTAGRVLSLSLPSSGIGVSPDGTVVGLIHDTRLTLWFDLAPPRSTVLPAQMPVTIGVSADGRWLAHAGPEPELRLVVTDRVAGTTIELPGITGVEHLHLSDDGRVLAISTADGRIHTWSPGSTDPPRVLGRGPTPRIAIGVVDLDHVLVFDRDSRVRLVSVGGTITSPCGDRVFLGGVGAVALVRDPGGVATCDVLTGAGVVVGPFHRVLAAQLSDDASRVLVIHDGGEVSLVRLADGVREPLPAVRDATSGELDATGARAVVVSQGAGTLVLERGAATPIAFTTPVLPTIPRISADGRRITAMVGSNVVAWRVDQPAHPFPLGELATRVMIRSLITPTSVIVISASTHPGADGAMRLGFALDEWLDGPAAPADVERWINRVAPR